MLLTARNITKTHGSGDAQIEVLRGVDLDLARGESVALTGESGSGKSTLLHILAALDPPDGGDVVLDEQRLWALGDSGRAGLRRRDIGLVFQQFNLIPSLTVADNLAFQARMAGRHDPALIADLAGRLGLHHARARFPEELSGGQQQRVAIGRAIAARPKLLLADEPTGNLDEDTADDVLSLMRALVAETGAGFLMVTHSQRLAARMDRRLTLRGGRLA